MFLKYAKNECGTDITEFKCETCGDIFTICPKVESANFDKWENCLAKECASYDPSRDADILFMSDDEISQEKIVSINMIKARRLGVSVKGVNQKEEQL